MRNPSSTRRAATDELLNPGCRATYDASRVWTPASKRMDRGEAMNYIVCACSCSARSGRLAHPACWLAGGRGDPLLRLSRVSPAPEPFRVLYVCTGNICRSAVAERLLRRELQERLGDDAQLFQVESAGVQGLAGEPMNRGSAVALASLGGDASGFVARRLNADHVREAGLILTANRTHRATVVRLDSTAARRAFTIREFAQLADRIDPMVLPEGDPASRLAAMVEEVATTRSTEHRHDLDVTDPYGSAAAFQAKTAALIGEATSATAGLLAAAARPDLAARSRPN
jgi:protein-tyrosine phosphatase